VNIAKTTLTIAALLSPASLSPAQVAQKKSLTADGARQVIAAAVADANSKKTTGVIDGKTLYLCARSGLYRMRVNIEGIRP
jgi:hypothetical protein